MRGLLLIAGGLILSGCASGSRPARPVAMLADYEEAPSSALVFDPPVVMQDAPLDLARDVRSPAAFIGFEQLTTTFSYVRYDDRQTNDFTDRFERRAVSEQVGVRQR